MGNLNKVMLIGRLGKDPEIRYTQSGSAVANFTLATSENWVDPQGQRKEKTEWHSVVAWNKLADLVQSYLKQGSQVYIEGKLQTRSWDDAQTGQKRYKTEISARTLQFLDSRPSDAGGSPQRPQAMPQAPQNPSYAPPQANASNGAEGTQRPPANPTASPPPEELPPADSYIEDDIPF